ncbi:uncharacterized protein J3D65DRAFT_666368 [Phyllosticta citribraziliensis]|uniref:Uncharacterized protein n=1 Tax=Phyllosticta citribraziliensis TaxID=989973 RepID=A0ABR1LWX5_9PEZI
MRAPHSATPAAFQTEPPHQECAGQEVLQTQTRRNWKKKLLLQPPELGEDSDLSSSSGSIVPYVHPTEGKTHLSIKDTEDYLTVQNPNPHTGRMSPAFSSVMTEHHEPVALRGAKDAGQAPQKYEGRAFEEGQRPRDRWPDFWRPLRKVSTLKRKPPAPYVEDEIEEPPDALSDVSPLLAQPSPTHFAAFDPDHLRIPGALRVSPPPPKTKTNGGTDAIATWVTTGSRKVYELPAVSPPPPEMELPSVPQHEPSSRHVRFSDDCPVRYPYYSPPPAPPVHHQIPTPPQTPQFAKIEIARKPLAHECEDDAPPVPPKHGYIPKTWSQSTQTRASVLSSRSHPIERAYQSDTISVEKVPTRLNGNGVPRIVVTTGKKVDQKQAKERQSEKDISKEKEKDKSRLKRREKGYRREKELLQAEPPKVQRNAERENEKKKERTAEVPDEHEKPKPKSKSKTTSTREPATTKTTKTSTTTTADRSATLKAALERIAAAKSKRVVSAPVKAPATATATAAAATKDPARSNSHTVSAIKPALAGSRQLPSSTTKAAAVEKSAINPAQPATTTSSSPETTTQQQTLVSLTITRANAILVAKLILALWGLLAAFYLLGALGRALWVILAPRIETSPEKVDEKMNVEAFDQDLTVHKGQLKFDGDLKGVFGRLLEKTLKNWHSCSER